MSIPHPIPYQGSKRNLASTILRYFPDDTQRLIEPFAGSAAVSIAAAYTGKATQFLLNDLNKPLVDLWESIINKPESLAQLYEHLWLAQLGRERRFYDLVRQRFNRTHHPYYFLYLLARCVKASVRYNTSGEFNQSPDNRRKGRQPEAMRHDILKTSSLFRGKTSLTSVDYNYVLEQAKPRDLIYMDPPYQGVCTNRDSRYIRGMSFDNFVGSLDKLNTRDISYLLSYDGRTGDKKFGQSLPDRLGLLRVELDAGRSSQATLLGRTERTYESLYLSPALLNRLNTPILIPQEPLQLSLFGELT
jgi:DNA adenine methylase